MIPVVRKLTQNSQTCEKQNRENTCQRKNITCIGQYLCGSAICLCPRSCKDFTIIKEKYTKCGHIVFFLSQKLQPWNPNHQNIGFYILRTWFTIGYKTATKYKVLQYSFFFSLKNYNHKTLITKTTVSISYAQDSQLYLYGLSLSAQTFAPWTKSQKISHWKPCNIISGQGGSSTRSNTIMT